MINATEAHEVAKAGAVYAETQKIVEMILPKVEISIREAADFGLYETKILGHEITSNLPWTFLTKASILKAVAEKLQEYGFTVSVPNSFSSIQIYW